MCWIRVSVDVCSEKIVVLFSKSHTIVEIFTSYRGVLLFRCYLSSAASKSTEGFNKITLTHRDEIGVCAQLNVFVCVSFLFIVCQACHWFESDPIADSRLWRMEIQTGFDFYSFRYDWWNVNYTLQFKSLFLKRSQGIYLIKKLLKTVNIITI